MSTEVVGQTAYELVYKDDPPLTDAQAEALAAEYSELGLHYEKCMWKGYNCVITRASAVEFEQFCERKSAHWQSIRERVGYSGLLIGRNNTYEPGRTSFSPGRDWNDVVAFIEGNFSSTSRAATPKPRPNGGQTPIKTKEENDEQKLREVLSHMRIQGGQPNDIFTGNSDELVSFLKSKYTDRYSLVRGLYPQSNLKYRNYRECLSSDDPVIILRNRWQSDYGLTTAYYSVRRIEQNLYTLYEDTFDDGY